MIDLTSDIVSAYVSKNNIPLADLPSLIASVHASLSALGQPAAQAVEDHRVTPAQIRKSVTPDHLISFIDGRSYKSLKRHLTSHGTNPEEYRRKFGLGHDYPMVAASYAAQRSELAKSLGLGQIRRRHAETAGAVEAPARRGRPRKDAAAAE
ncbi:MucR family transcriptional regulator [Methylobacterium oryzihabitans]|nr:MucR family transcriptional regulator [Methylobacterium oryzihabitans]